jgi:hypothetical protein
VAFFLFAVVACHPGSQQHHADRGRRACGRPEVEHDFGPDRGNTLTFVRDDSTAHCSSYRNDFCLRSNGRTKEERWTQRECPRSFRA